MSDQITVRGFVATDPTQRSTKSGANVASFRLATTERRYDRLTQAWVDGATNWYTVNCFRALAENVGTCLRKGQPVVVTGRLRIRAWQSEERSGTAVEIEADGIGQDLAWGVNHFTRVGPRTETGDQGAAASDRPQDTDAGYGDPSVGENTDADSVEYLDDDAAPSDDQEGSGSETTGVYGDDWELAPAF